ncbi:Peptidyl-prolyl cis-trans isomerase FKBP14 [Balamuthia mandrillaris]
MRSSKPLVVALLLASLLLVLCLLTDTAEATRRARRKHTAPSSTTSASSSGPVDAAPDATLEVEVEHRPDDCPRKSANGDTVAVHYIGFLQDGTPFDTSLQRNEPLKLTLGQGAVIEGWEQGLLGMCKGERRRLTIPPHLGYGDAGFPPVIPPNALSILNIDPRFDGCWLRSSGSEELGLRIIISC